MKLTCLSCEPAVSSAGPPDSTNIMHTTAAQPEYTEIFWCWAEHRYIIFPMLCPACDVCVLSIPITPHPCTSESLEIYGTWQPAIKGSAGLCSDSALPSLKDTRCLPSRGLFDTFRLLLFVFLYGDGLFFFLIAKPLFLSCWKLE